MLVLITVFGAAVGVVCVLSALIIALSSNTARDAQRSSNENSQPFGMPNVYRPLPDLNRATYLSRTQRVPKYHGPVDHIKLLAPPSTAMPYPTTAYSHSSPMFPQPLDPAHLPDVDTGLQN